MRTQTKGMKKHRWNDNHGPDRLMDPPKFTVTKTRNGERIGDDGEFFFVLRPERDREGWRALVDYSYYVEHRSPNMARELRSKLFKIGDEQLYE